MRTSSINLIWFSGKLENLETASRMRIIFSTWTGCQGLTLGCIYNISNARCFYLVQSIKMTTRPSREVRVYSQSQSDELRCDKKVVYFIFVIEIFLPNVILLLW
jgi:hypothetical protein